MKFKLQIIAASVLLPLSMGSFATTEALTGAFKTIKDVTIVEVAGNEMVINGLRMTALDECTVTTITTAANWPGDTLMLAATSGTSAPSATYGATTGTGCSTGTSVPGIYEIDGAEGAAVDITLSATTDAGGVSFAPVGCAIDYDGGSNGDLCKPVANGATTNITLANTADQTVSAGEGQPVSGKSRLVLGGQAIALVGLAAATPYVVPFDITVTY
ncbi:MAG: hypothetical protein QNK36_18800 [Colwellia sp.]|nr:hypothetical protein [Colwellia sp.]